MNQMSGVCCWTEHLPWFRTNIQHLTFNILFFGGCHFCL